MRNRVPDTKQDRENVFVNKFSNYLMIISLFVNVVVVVEVVVAVVASVPIRITYLVEMTKKRKSERKKGASPPSHNYEWILYKQPKPTSNAFSQFSTNV